MRSDSLREWLEARRADASVVTYRLESLTQAQVGEFLRSMLGEDEARPEVATWLHRLTDGNPFFLEETVKSLREEGVLVATDSHWSLKLQAAATGKPSGEFPLEALKLSDKLRATVGRRLRPLPAPARELLRVASVLGRDFDIGLVEQLGSRPREEFLDVIDVLLREGVLVEPRGALDRLRFRHDLLREVVYVELPRARRRECTPASPRCSPRGAGDDLIAIAYHAAAADDSERALNAVCPRRRAPGATP